MKKLSSIIQKIRRSNIIIPIGVFVDLLGIISGVVSYLKAKKDNKKKSQIIAIISASLSAILFLKGLNKAFKPEEIVEEETPLDDLSSLEEEDLDD